MIRRVLVPLLVAVGVLVVVVAALAAFALSQDRVTTTRPGPVRTVEVDLDAGRVEVAGEESDEAVVDRSRRYLLRAPRISETLVDGVLRIEADCRAFVVACKVDYRLGVPGGVPVRIRTRSGSVGIADIRGPVDVETDAGGIRLARTRGPVRVSSSAGNVDGAEVAPEFLDATTGAGRIRLSFAAPPPRATVRTAAGNVDLALPPAQGGYRVAAEAGTGKVDVEVEEDPGSNRAIIANTGAGNIRIRPR